MIRTAVLLTCYNRPTLVVDAIKSVLSQEPRDFRLYVLDDGCDPETRSAIHAALSEEQVRAYLTMPPHRAGEHRAPDHDPRVVWWLGPKRSMAERKASIPYSRSINLALNHLLSDEPYVTYLCDDDVLLPGSIAARANYLEAHPEADVVFGRLRAVQYDLGGYNTWQQSSRPRAGWQFVPPDGERIFNPEIGNARHFYADGGSDPETGLAYVEEGFWLPGPCRYGEPHRVDHNQVMHRRACLRDGALWAPRTRSEGFVEYWPEGLAWGVGDAGFFQALGSRWEFVGVDCWAASKRYHGLSDGVSHAEVRE